MNLFSGYMLVPAANCKDSKVTFHFPFPFFRPLVRAHSVAVLFREGMLSDYLSLKNISQPQKARHKGELRICRHFCRRAIADDLTAVQDQDPICNRKGFLLIMSNIDRRDICAMQDRP